MTAAHEAFRRDLTRLATPANPTIPAPASVDHEWLDRLQEPDAQASPRRGLVHLAFAAERLAGSEAAISVRDEMDAEHELIAPLLAAVDGAFARPDASDVAGVIGVIGELATTLSYHLSH
jgi:hypothetical protein